MPIPFTEYVLPNGRQSHIEVKRSAEIERMAQAIIAAGYRFECEQLRTGVWSYTVTDDDADHANELSKHDPKNSVAIDTMITEFYNQMSTSKEQA